MKTMRIACPKCGVRLGVTREMQGRTLRCAGCQQHLRFGRPAALRANALRANAPQASLSRSSQDSAPQAIAKQQSKGSSRAAKPAAAAAPVAAPVAAPFLAAPKSPASQPLDLTVPRLSAFSGRVWGGFAAALLLLGGAVAASLFFAP